MPNQRNRVRSRLAIAAEKAEVLTKIKALYDEKATRLKFQIGNGPRFNATECGAVTFDPTLDENNIQFQRPNSALTGAGKEETYLTAIVDVAAQASGSLDLTTDIVLTSVAMGVARNDATFQTVVEAAADNPTNTVLAVFTGTSAAVVCTVTPNDGTNNPVGAATGSLAVTTPIVLTSVAPGIARNDETVTLEIAAAADNPTDTILAVWSGTSAAQVLTITPNDGTNNSATPVDLTTAQLVEYLNTGDVAALTGQISETDGSGFRALQTASGGDATVVVNSGEGDSVVATFAGGTNPAVDLTTAELVELINQGSVAGKTVTVTDSSTLRALQTATGGDATALAASGEGDDVTATFADGVDSTLNNTYFSLSEAEDAETFHVWFNVNSEGVDPAPESSTAIEVAVAVGDAASAIATAAAAAIDAKAEFVSSVVSGAQFKVVNAAEGYATDVVDVDSGFTIAKQGELEMYDNADIIMIKRLRTKKYLIKLADAADPAYDAGE